MICALMTILMLDRVCLSVAGPRMQATLHIGPAAWGWVNEAFAIAFACFEIPMGVLGDRLGPRKMLTGIVVWWSDLVDNPDLIALIKSFDNSGKPVVSVHSQAVPSYGVTATNYKVLNPVATLWPDPPVSLDKRATKRRERPLR